MDLRDIQTECSNWIASTFGPAYLISSRERAFRVLEEAAELAQSLGLQRWEANAVLDQVFAKPIDPDVGKEVAGVIVCAMGAATAAHVDANQSYLKERDWRHANQALCREKHARKTAVAITGGYNEG